MTNCPWQQPTVTVIGSWLLLEPLKWVNWIFTIGIIFTIKLCLPNILTNLAQVRSCMVELAYTYIYLYISYWKPNIIHLLMMCQSFTQKNYTVNLYIWDLGMVYLSLLIVKISSWASWSYSCFVSIHTFISSFIHSLQADALGFCLHQVKPNLDLSSQGV